LFARQKCFQLILPFRDETKKQKTIFSRRESASRRWWTDAEKKFFLFLFFFGLPLKAFSL
jgi:hypothetical protein